MIHINKGGLSTFPVTIKEKRVNNSGVTIYYLINLNNDMTKKNWWSYGAQTITRRYTAFSINDSIGSPPLPLPDEGFYTYKIYEVTSLSIDFTDVDNVAVTDSQIVETGKAFVKDASVTEVTYTQYTPTDNTNTLNSNTQYISI
ncbi:MAG: hypothetical protein Unbinned92contig1003_3 [Prokaryotic dsDNA virus sp.]|mgnify:CR=1 FL=1|nr:MAG: hypothetical protein Unbinned92contig1003_3 [Prokaryotic dsDNA virus sp.]|tara:strand:+ start:17625 stop:18056 length:432 start_codon:yes stop_codon:yes gene_type:complete